MQISSIHAQAPPFAEQVDFPFNQNADNKILGWPSSMGSLPLHSAQASPFAKQAATPVYQNADNRLLVRPDSMGTPPLHSATNASEYASEWTEFLGWQSDWAGLFVPAHGSGPLEYATLALQVYNVCPKEGDQWFFSNGWELAISETDQVPMCMNVRGTGEVLDSTDIDGHDNVAIYKKTINSELHCVLAYEGTTDFKNWWSNGKGLLGKEYCGHNVHQGFADEMAEFSGDLGAGEGGYITGDYLAGRIPTNPEKTTEYLNFFKSCNKRYYTGHSLGGGQATLLALCMNTKFPSEYGGAVYSFAAPGTYYGEVWDVGTEDCSERGLRTINENDPVPGLASKLYFRHPKMDVLQFNTSYDYDDFDDELILKKKCGESAPEDLTFFPPLGTDKDKHSMNLHVMNLMLHQKLSPKLWIDSFLGSYTLVKNDNEYHISPGGELLRFQFNMKRGVFSVQTGGEICAPSQGPPYTSCADISERVELRKTERDRHFKGATKNLVVSLECMTDGHSITFNIDNLPTGHLAVPATNNWPFRP